jgi:hypothetical protein
MSYLRVIPRDLFNEANLLKCYGTLWIAIEGHRQAKFSQECMDSFPIVMRDDDGSLCIDGLFLDVGEAQYRLTRPCNSREPFPLYAERVEFWADPVAVFNPDGTLSDEFTKLINLQPFTP